MRATLMRAENKRENSIIPTPTKMLYDDNFSSGDYIDYPRGRVIWDKEKSKAIIYIDPCIDKKNVLDEIAEAFEVGEYVTASDFHYHCKNCSDALFDDMDW